MADYDPQTYDPWASLRDILDPVVKGPVGLAYAAGRKIGSLPGELGDALGRGATAVGQEYDKLTGKPYYAHPGELPPAPSVGVPPLLAKPEPDAVYDPSLDPEIQRIIAETGGHASGDLSPGPEYHAPVAERTPLQFAWGKGPVQNYTPGQDIRGSQYGSAPDAVETYHHTQGKLGIDHTTDNTAPDVDTVLHPGAGSFIQGTNATPEAKIEAAREALAQRLAEDPLFLERNKSDYETANKIKEVEAATAGRAKTETSRDTARIAAFDQQVDAEAQGQISQVKAMQGVPDDRKAKAIENIQAEARAKKIRAREEMINPKALS